MAIERTAQNLATFCLQVVGTAYWMGCFGQKASRSLYNQKKADYPQYYPPKSWTEASFVDDFGKPVTDCAGLIKWFLWAKSMEDKTPTYKASEDWGSNTLYNKCKEKGKIKTLPSEKVGICVFKLKNGVRTHVGVIVNNDGKVVEAKGHAYGTVTSKASDWDEWGKHPLIKYESVPTPAPTPIPEPVPTPAPTPIPEPVVTVLDDYQVVNIHTYLAIRSTPHVDPNDKNLVGKLFNDAVVTVFEIKNGWARIGGEMWVSLKYLKKV